jgi:hypothetical protein
LAEFISDGKLATFGWKEGSTLLQVV